MNPMPLWRTLIALALCSALPVLHAQTSYPNKPIRIIVPFTPAGTTDILARAIGQELSKAWGQSVVIENAPGAGGSLGSEKAAKALPDGYTLLMGHIGTLAFNPSIYPKLPYDPVKSFTPVALVANVANVLVINPALPAKNLSEFIALAKSKPGQFNYGSGGNGSAANIATEYFKQTSKIFVVHVPYRGTAPAVTDVIAGQTQMTFTGAPAVMPFVKSGQLRALAVSSSKRLDSLPDLPTIAESGYKGFEADQWYGVVAPAGTPREIVVKLNTQINLALASPELKARLVSEGASANPMSPEAFGTMIAKETARWSLVIKAGNVRAD